MQSRRKPVTTADMLSLVESQGYKCALTGRELTPDVASLDHKTPLSRGGDHALENLWVLHKDINAAKSTMTVDEFVAMCREVAQRN